MLAITCYFSDGSLYCCITVVWMTGRNPACENWRLSFRTDGWRKSWGKWL